MDRVPENPLPCHRCGKLLEPGRGDLYVVRIEAVADPSPQRLDDYLGQGDLFEKMEELIEQMRDMSPLDLMHQVYRRLTITLCGPCYRQWIEDPSR
jgi:hypothetical protein